MLKFIFHFFTPNILLYLISIHPMLKFIYKTVYGIYQNAYISIHPMLKFIPKNICRELMWLNFNTSHVKVYLVISIFMYCKRQISIHPMLKFICYGPGSWCNFAKISIHPMLKFIARWSYSDIFSRRISIHPMLKFILTFSLFPSRKINYFNTSHVKVYLNEILKEYNYF